MWQVRAHVTMCDYTVSMDFVQDIIIPSYALQTPSYLCVKRVPVVRE